GRPGPPEVARGGAGGRRLPAHGVREDPEVRPAGGAAAGRRMSGTSVQCSPRPHDGGMADMRRFPVLIVALVLGMLVLPACGGGGGGGAHAVSVSGADFAFAAPEKLDAGLQKITFHNSDTKDDHEAQVVRLDAGHTQTDAVG